MHSIRRRLIALVLVMLAGQLAGMAATPTVLCQMGGAATSASDDEIACTCPRGPNGECPMHTHKKPASSSRETRWCAGCQDNEDAVLTTLIGFAGVIVPRQHPVVPEGVSASVGALVERPLNLLRPPVSPPPRG